MHDALPAAEALAWLERLGYRVALREDGWLELLLCRGDERWIGRGIGRDEALDDVIRQLFPSHAARAAARAMLASPATDRSVAAPEPTPGGVSAPERASASVDAAPANLEVVASGLAPSQRLEAPAPASAPAARTPTPAEHVEEAPVDPAPAAHVIVTPGGNGTPAPDVAAIVLDIPPPMDTGEALAEVAILNELIDSKRPELSLMTPERQRLAILAWICHARAIQAASGSHNLVVNRVTNIARKLTLLSKLWWPGSVTALQIDATPRDVGRELELPPAARPRTWAEGAEASESKLRAVEERDERLSRDEYGWSDSAFLDPRPINPSGQILELRRLIEQVAGSLEQKPPSKVPPSVRRPSDDDRKRFERWCMRIRWLRGYVAEFDTWGTLLGRLRWITAQADRRDPGLTQLLDPTHHPRRSWAQDLHQNPEAKRKQRLRKAVLQRRPWPTNEPGTESVVSWLLDAFQVLEAERIAKLVAPFHDLVMSLEPDDLPDTNRHKRRRLRQVKKFLGSISEEEVQSIVAEIGEPVAGDDDAPEDEYVEEERPTRDPGDILLEAVRPRTRGKRALFVSNRNDPDLETAIRDCFAFGQLDWCEGSPRRVQTVAERVSKGSYDIVLGATGFQSHSMDTHLIRACRRASVPYVRVHRGRQLACTIAIARELGIAVSL